MTRKTVNLILVGIITFELSFLAGLYFVYNSTRIKNSPPVSKEYILADGRLGYNYLKSVTVYIQGQGVAEAELFGLKLGKQVVNWAGTGIIVKIDGQYTYILTNAHMVGQLKEEPIENAIVYVRNEEKQVLAEIVKVHSTEDMALIRIEGNILNKRAINGLAVANIQDKVFMVGHSLGTPYVYAEGVHAGFYKQYDLYMIPSCPGDSGSGIFNNDGNLVALLFAGRMINMFQVDNNNAIAIDSSLIKLFLTQEGIL